MLFVQKGAKLGDCMFSLVTMKLDEFTAEFRALFEKLPEIVDKALQLSGLFPRNKWPFTRRRYPHEVYRAEAVAVALGSISSSHHSTFAAVPHEAFLVDQKPS